MPGRISKHSFAVELGRAQTKHVRRRIGDTLDHDVEVHLLRDGRVRPGRRTMVRSELEREPRGRVISRGDHEIVACVGDRVVQERGVEPRECTRVRTVQDDVVQASVHALNGLSRRPQLPQSARVEDTGETAHKKYLRPFEHWSRDVMVRRRRRAGDGGAPARGRRRAAGLAEWSKASGGT
jgi:hypothetical protein